MCFGLLKACVKLKCLLQHQAVMVNPETQCLVSSAVLKTAECICGRKKIKEGERIFELNAIFAKCYSLPEISISDTLTLSLLSHVPHPHMHSLP